MVVMASNGPWPHSSSLRPGLPTPQPLRRHHTQSLLGPSFHDPRTHHVLDSHPERAAPLSRRDDEQRHAVDSHSALALCLYLASCNPSSSSRFWVLDHLSSNLPQQRASVIPFHSCWIITQTRNLNLCVCFYLFLSCFCFSDKNRLRLWVPVQWHFVRFHHSNSTVTFTLAQFLGSIRNMEAFWDFAVPSVCNAVGLFFIVL